MTQQKQLAAIFVAGALAGGFGGASVTTDDGTVAPAEVRPVVAEDLFETPTVAHLDRLRAKHRCNNTGGCHWQITARVKVPATVAGIEPKTSAAGFRLGDRPDLVPVVQPLLDAAAAKACDALAGEHDGGPFAYCVPTFVGVRPAEGGAFDVSVVVDVDGGGEALKYAYTTEGASTAAVSGLVSQAIDLLCADGGLCPGGAPSPTTDAGN